MSIFQEMYIMYVFIGGTEYEILSRGHDTLQECMTQAYEIADVNGTLDILCQLVQQEWIML